MKIHEILPLDYKNGRKDILERPDQFGTTRKSPVAHRWVSNSEEHWSKATIRAGTEVCVVDGQEMCT